MVHQLVRLLEAPHTLSRVARYSLKAAAPLCPRSSPRNLALARRRALPVTPTVRCSWSSRSLVPTRPRGSVRGPSQRKLGVRQATSLAGLCPQRFHLLLRRQNLAVVCAAPLPPAWILAAPPRRAPAKAKSNSEPSFPFTNPVFPLRRGQRPIRTPTSDARREPDHRMSTARMRPG